MGSKIGETINSIMEVAQTLHKQGIKPTQTRVAKELGLTRQAVSISLINHKKLDEFNNLKYSQEQVIFNFLKKVDTSEMSIRDIYRLPIQGVIDISIPTFSYMLKKNGIRYKYDVLTRMRAIDTSQLTAKEIAQELGVSEDHVRRTAKSNKISYQRKKLPHGVFDKLRTIDTSQYTVKELHELIGEHTNIGSLRSYIHDNKLPYKKILPKNS